MQTKPKRPLEPTRAEVERVAQALYQYRMIGAGSDFRMWDDVNQEYYRRMARAALAALREPR